MKFYIVIPARYDSKRFPGKVLKKIQNITILEHVYITACKSDAAKVFITTDSDIVYNEAKKFCENVFITSINNKNGTERVAELARVLDWNRNLLVINLQADMPQIQFDNINFLAEKTKINDNISTLYCQLNGKKLLKDKNVVKIRIENSHIEFFREKINNLQNNVYKHIGIYSYLVNDLYLYKSYPQSKNELKLSLEQYRFLDNKLKMSAYCAVSDPGISVDTPDNIDEIMVLNN